MIIIKDSGVNHWALAQSHECEQCRTIFKATVMQDFRSGTEPYYVWMNCPRCNREQKMHKNRPKPVTPYITYTTGTTNLVESPSLFKS
jgi:hypothetical protein